VSDLLAISSVKLLESRREVFKYRTGGKAVHAQSVDIPLRTTKALVKAAKSMTMAARPIHNPVRYARAGTPQP